MSRAPHPLILLGHAGNYADLVDTVEDLNDGCDQRGAGGESNAAPASGDRGPPYRLLGFLDDRDELQGRVVHGYPVLGRYVDAHRFPEALLSTWIGSVGTCLRRPAVIAALGLPRERFVTIVHPTAYVSRRARLGYGVVVLQHCTVAAQAVLGDHVVVLPNSVISHDDTIGDYTVITGGVAIAGHVTTGTRCYLGTNSSIHQGVTIGEGSLVGMGSVVRHDVLSFQVVAGNPARVLRQVTRPEAISASSAPNV